ncbi:hypothetical protein [Lactococcus petauri]|uniref:hypothetical protein n=1 Tax=Lactococcus petauri TaxID=1940789 RepID=UPI00254E09DD|nr:hypothetical protein [Lactococcus petauri]
MTSEKKRKLRNIAILALLGLIGGTFAFQAFNQQAINDRLRENQQITVGGYTITTTGTQKIKISLLRTLDKNPSWSD